MVGKVCWRILRRRSQDVKAVRNTGVQIALADGTEGPPGGDLVQRLCGVDICVVFSPPRVGLAAAKFGLKAGDATDLTIKRTEWCA